MNTNRLHLATKLVAVAFAIGTAPCSVRAQSPVTLDYWVYSDYAQGDALKMQQAFIDEFKKTHPNVTINISGKGDDDLLTGEVTGAASGTLPDVFMNGVDVGAQLAQVGALKNIYAEWMATPASYRAQFSAEEISTCTPKPQTMYCIPYTGFGTFVFRNLDVLKAAGIDPATPIKDWSDWLAQMQKIKAVGKFAIPDETQVWQSVVEIYSGAAGPNDWGVDFASKKTKVDPQKMAAALKFFKDMKPYTSGTSRNDQATKDLFISNQLAFHIVGPWVNPTYEQAAKQSGLKYDYVLVPGISAGQYGGIKGYEFLGIAPGKNAKTAFEFAAYITDKDQMVRWAKLLSRYNANAAAMSDPTVMSLSLMKMTKDAVDHAHFNMPPYFVDSFPNCYHQLLTDKAAAVADGNMSPEDGAKDLVQSLNACLSQG